MSFKNPEKSISELLQRFFKGRLKRRNRSVDNDV